MLGKTLFSKISNSIVLILLLGYAAYKVLPLLGIQLEAQAEFVSKEVVTLNSDQFTENSQIQERLSTFKINEVELSDVLFEQNIELEEFYKKVKLEFVLPKNIQSTQSLTIEFITNKHNPKYLPGYKNVAKQISEHFNG